MTTPNSHVWYELMTNDQDAAEAFYADVVGWKVTDSGMPGMRYTIINAGERPVGGVLEMAEMPPLWFGYVGVDDVDAYAKKVTDAGGTVHKGPEDIPNVGRFAVVADPQGAVFVLFKGSNDMPDFAPLPYMTPGTTGWHELHTSDWEAAFAFYSELFRWQKDEAMDMGPMGTYQLFKTDANPVGAMFNSPNIPRPMWLYYFSVPGIDAAQKKLEAGGGKVLNGPMEVPGGMWIVQATDPQGAMFALVGPKG